MVHQESLYISSVIHAFTVDVEDWAHGIPIPDGQRERVKKFALTLDAGAYSSLHTDVTAGRRTELETLLGTVVRLGRTYDVPTPASRAIYAALKPYDRPA